MNISLTIHALSLTDLDFERICRANPELSFEQTSLRELVVAPLTGGTFGRKKLNLVGQFSNWVEQNLELGEGFDSSTLFVLPNGAKRSRNGQVAFGASPTIAWVARERWNALTQKQQDGYPPLCPDFVIELRSPADCLEELQAKMQEYIDNGARLGWLIDPIEEQIETYRPGKEVEFDLLPIDMDDKNMLPGFVLDCGKRLLT